MNLNKVLNLSNPVDKFIADLAADWKQICANPTLQSLFVDSNALCERLEDFGVFLCEVRYTQSKNQLHEVICFKSEIYGAVDLHLVYQTNENNLKTAIMCKDKISHVFNLRLFSFMLKSLDLINIE